MSHPLPEVIDDRYQVKRVLGAGGMGRVVEAYDPKLRRDVALKLVEPVQGMNDKERRELRFMFHREARAMARLRHPSLVEVYDYSGPTAEIPYLVCPLIDAPTVAKVLADEGARSPQTVAAMGHELCDALLHMHQEGIVHRDLKPENIFWHTSGRVQLGDFGIARAFDGGVVLDGTMAFGDTRLFGSPGYMAPEQLEGAEPAPPSDIHALGTVLFELTTGFAVYKGSDVRAVVAAVHEGRRASVPEEVPEVLATALNAFLDRSPDARPDAERARGMLRDALDALEVTDPRRQLEGFGLASWQAGSGAATAEISVLPPDPDATKLMHEPDATVLIDPQGQTPQHGKDNDEDNDGTEAYEPVGPVVSARPKRRNLLLERAPFIFAMVSMALALGAGAYLLRQLTSQPKGVPSTTEVSVNPAAPPTAPEVEEVMVLLRFAGKGSVTVDGAPFGTWEDTVRLSVTPGKHLFAVTVAGRVIERQVLVLPGTSPEFLFE